MLCKEVYKSCFDDATEQLPQITAHTDASVIVWVLIVSTLEYGRYASSVPGFREMTNTQNQVKHCFRGNPNSLSYSFPLVLRVHVRVRAVPVLVLIEG